MTKKNFVHAGKCFPIVRKVIPTCLEGTELKPWEIIQKLGSDNSRLFKESVVKESLDNAEFVEGIKLALDPLITFGVKDIPTTVSDSAVSKGLLWEEFVELATKLQNRELTGHAALNAIVDAQANATTEQWNDWYRRILIKDLRCGVSEKTVNNVRKGTVPIFGCMLAHDGAKHEKKIAGECFIEYKYDGVRVIAIVQNNTATLYSRNGKLLSNFPHIEAALSKPEFNGIVFDGEVMSENFQALMKQVHRKEGAQTADAYLAVFDMISLPDFKQGHCDQVAEVRRHWLEAVATLFDHCIRLVDCERMNLDTSEGKAQFAAMNKRALEEGYEGLMIKPVSAPYDCKRSHAWLKIKPFIEVTLEVKEVEEGTGRNEGRLGAFVCEGTDDGRHICVNVGSGFTDADRDSFWNHRDAVVGHLVEVRADAITQNQDGTYSLRFPRFKTFRGFEAHEKL